jgi:hypothetical protein
MSVKQVKAFAQQDDQAERQPSANKVHLVFTAAAHFRPHNAAFWQRRRLYLKT